jgi:Hemopexin
LSIRVDEYLHVDREERDYPRKIRDFWRNVDQIKLDTAFQKDGITYFFSGKTFYKFNDKTRSLEIKKPLVSSQYWMNCQYSEEEIESIQKEARVQNEGFETSTAAPPPTTTLSVFTLLLSAFVCRRVFLAFEFTFPILM